MASIPQETLDFSDDSPRVAAEWAGLFDTIDEADAPVTQIEGTVPAGLVGTLYRNGPGVHDYAESFFDGDGLIRALTFREDGGVHFKSRYVRTPKYEKQTKLGRAVSRGVGTNLPGGWFRNAFRTPAHEANTSVLWHEGELFALEEGGHPYRIGADDLSTIGMTDFDGALSMRNAFTAHPHVDPETGDAICFGTVFGMKMGLRAFRLDRGGRFHDIGTVPKLRDSFVHDFAITPNWLVFFFTPTITNILPILLGTSTYFDEIEYKPELGTAIALMPRGGGDIIELETDPFQVGHFVGAFEEGGEVIVDLCQLDNWSQMGDAATSYRTSDWEGYGGSTVRRHRIDPKTKNLSSETICSLPAEFPRICADTETRRGRYAYFAANTREKEGGWFRATMKLDRETGATDLHDYGRYKVGLEPLFVPRPGGTDEDDGWLLTYVHDGKNRASQVAILDARNVSDGPVATLTLPGNTGITFHGTWRPGA